MLMLMVRSRLFVYVTHKPSFPPSDSLPRSGPLVGCSHASSIGLLSSGAVDIPPFSDHDEPDHNADSDDDKPPPILKVRPYGSIPKNAQIIRYSDKEEEEFTTERR